MWQDPIVTETRLLREQYANQFDHNADAIFQDILRRQIASGRRLVSFQARKPVFVPIAAQHGTQPALRDEAAQRRLALRYATQT